jgi:hypothetical protein
VGHCYTCNGDKLFPEIWFIIRRSFRWGDQNINDDDLSLSGWLKQNGITKFDYLSDIDNFIHADDNSMTSGIPTERDAIQTILNKEAINENKVEFVDYTVSTKSVKLTHKLRML